MKRKYLISIALVLCLLIVGAGSAEAKSLYVLSNTNSASSPIQAYDINAAGITYQTTHPTNSGWGEVGVAIDSNSGFLFITHETSGQLYLVDGTTMTAAGTVTAPGASNLAGIVVDEDKQRVYAVDRYTTRLYVYDWDSSAKSLTAVAGSPFTMPIRGIGLALDEANDLLYVTAATNTVAYYGTGDWANMATNMGTIVLGQGAVGIAVEDGKYLYTAGFTSRTLSQYDLIASSENKITTTYGTVGLAVDQDTGRVYATKGYSGDRVEVYDSSLTLIDTTNDIGDPTGLCVPRTGISYNPLSLAKTDGVATVNPDGTLTYTISYTNPNQDPVTGVTITDTLPSGVTWVSGGIHVAGVVTWNIGGLSGTDSVQVTVTVDHNTPIGAVLDNTATIDSDDTPPTTQHDFTTVVAPNGGEIPEFPTIVLPMAAILGLAFIFQRRKD